MPWVNILPVSFDGALTHAAIVSRFEDVTSSEEDAVPETMSSVPSKLRAFPPPIVFGVLA